MHGPRQELVKTSKEALTQHIDLRELLSALSYSDGEVAEAARQQPVLFLLSGVFRVKKLRKRQKIEAELKLRRSQLSRNIKKEFTELGQKFYKGDVDDKLSRNSEVIALEAQLAAAEQEEEFGKLLLEAFRMRSSSLKIVAELVGAEVYVSRKMENDGTEIAEIAKQLKKKYPGQSSREDRRRK